VEIKIKRIESDISKENFNMSGKTNTYLVIDSNREFKISCNLHIHGNSLCLAEKKGTLHTDMDNGKVYRQIVTPGGGCGLIINDEIVEGLSPWALQGIIIAEQKKVAKEILIKITGSSHEKPVILINGIPVDYVHS